MDSIFLLDQGERANFLHQIVLSFGCTYICLWSYLPQPSNCLIFMDGFYNNEADNQSSSSSGILAQRLFDEYRQSVFLLQNDCIPGLAFKNNSPYIELKNLDLQRLASIEPQSQFYQEAGIKTAIFMGCKTGEIELGMPNEPQANLETEMRNWFPDNYFSQKAPLLIRDLSYPIDQSHQLLSSSSSLMRSVLSMDNLEGSPAASFLFDYPNTPYNIINQEPCTKETTPIHQPLRTTTTTITKKTTPPPNPFQEAMKALDRIRKIHFPTRESEDDTMTKAIIAVISSPSSTTSSSSSSSSLHQPQQNQISSQNVSTTAFKNYRSTLAAASSTQMRVISGKQHMLKRAITLFGTLNLMRRSQDQAQGSRHPTINQLHHMISERRRREKINESFEALRSLLPSRSKKDKASVLSSTTEYLSCLKAQVEELIHRNQVLEAQLLPQTTSEATYKDHKVISGTSSSNGRSLHVRVANIADESTSEARIIDLQVNLRGECNLLDLAICVVEFLKQVDNVRLMSVEANTQMVQSNPSNSLILRLKIEGVDWDESAFQEAVRRVVADLAQ